MAQKPISKTPGTAAYKRRQRRIALRKAVDPLAPELTASANLRYGDVEREVASQGRISDAASGRLPGYFRDYQARLASLRGQQQQGYEASRADIERSSAASAALAQQGNQQALDAAQRQAAITGGEVDVNAVPRAAASVASRQDAASVFGGGLRARQAEAGTFALGREAVAEGERISQMLEERKRRNLIGTKQADLAKEKGDYKVAKREEIIGARHRRILERKAFGLDVSRAEQDALEEATKLQAGESDKAFKRRAKRRDQALAERREDRLSQPKPDKAAEKERRKRQGIRGAAEGAARNAASRLKLYDPSNPRPIHKERRKRLINSLMVEYGPKGLTRRQAQEIVWETAFGSDWKQQLGMER